MMMTHVSNGGIRLVRSGSKLHAANNRSAHQDYISWLQPVYPTTPRAIVVLLCKKASIDRVVSCDSNSTQWSSMEQATAFLQCQANFH